MTLPITFSNDSFYCEHLLESEENEFLIQNFTVKNSSGENLASYLKEFAVQSETRNDNKTYLIKDKSTHEIAGYFALRNGLFALDAGSGNMFTIPSIELSNFAVNETYRQQHPDIKRIGELIFKRFILPLSKHIQSLTGVQALYIYALPEDRLIDHYGSFGFTRLEKADEKFVHQHVKPAYDDGCIFMYQIL